MIKKQTLRRKTNRKMNKLRMKMKENKTGKINRTKDKNNLMID